ncbi:MAG: hypothetical protein QF654_03500 [Alphaproteobacteria bacterium]|jgi:hypothetical protein|nr:hypothetical protein [Alphaproteobacteria bacterium]
MSDSQQDDKPTERDRRRFYVIAFVVAFAIDVVVSMMDGGSYKPSLIGLAIMITAGLFFVYSLIRKR